MRRPQGAVNFFFFCAGSRPPLARGLATKRKGDELHALLVPKCPAAPKQAN